MKKILVTGSTGFIGNYVIQQLLKHNCKVIATSSDAEKAKKALWFPAVTYMPFDLREFKDHINYYDHFDAPDSMIHLAWEGLPHYKGAFHIEENLPRHFSFLKNCLENGLADVTVAGTCLEYGMREGCLSEEMDTKPATAYSIAKDLLRRQLEELQYKAGFQLKWVRLFYIYGRGQSFNSLLSQLDVALAKKEPMFNMSGGQQQRDYLPVEKVAESIVKIALQKRVTGVINCCSGKPITIKAFVENYLNQNQKYIPLNLGYYPYADYEPMCFWGDNRKLKSITDND